MNTEERGFWGGFAFAYGWNVFIGTDGILISREEEVQSIRNLHDFVKFYNNAIKEQKVTV